MEGFFKYLLSGPFPGNIHPSTQRADCLTCRITDDCSLIHHPSECALNFPDSVYIHKPDLTGCYNIVEVPCYTLSIFRVNGLRPIAMRIAFFVESKFC